MHSRPVLAVIVPCLLLAGASHAAPPAPKTLSPTPLKALNSAGGETDPSTTPGDVTLYYSARVHGRYEVRVARRRNHTYPWRKGQALPDLQGKADYRTAFLTNDKRYPQYLYYATNVDVMNEGAQGSNFDIYFLIKQGRRADWTTPTPIHSVDTAADEMDPWLSADFRQLYFSRKDKDGWHIYVAARETAHANFDEPTRLDFPAGFRHATLTPDGRVMYLQGPLPKGRSGLFRSQKIQGKWSKPKPLDALNSPTAPTGDRAPCLSRNGRMLYFASDRGAGQGTTHLWMIAVGLLK
jgi:hypothetical protein